MDSRPDCQRRPDSFGAQRPKRSDAVTFKSLQSGERLAWTNDEGDAGQTITTVVFEEKGSKTLLAVHDLYASKEALEAALASGEKSGTDETFAQLDELLASLSKR